jgi:hypothetical protein
MLYLYCTSVFKTEISELPVCFARYRAAAKKGLLAYNGFMQLGGGINPDNAAEWLDSGASHLIVTSYIFQDGELNEDRLKELVSQGYIPCFAWEAYSWHLTIDA